MTTGVVSMSDVNTVISSTTQVSPPPSFTGPKTRANTKNSSTANAKENTGRVRASMREIRLLEENAQLSRQLAESNAKHIRKLEEEVERLRDALRDTCTCNVLLYTSKDELSVAAVTNGSPEGLELFARAEELFRSNERELHKKGIAFAVIEDIPVNQLHETPLR